MKLALAQMQMSERIEENLKQTLRLIHEAAEQGADLICFPEIQLSPFFPQYTGLDVTGYLLQENDPAVRAVQAACRENRIFASPNFYLQYGDRCYDTSLFIDARGDIIGRQKMVHIAQCPWFALTAIIPRASARRHCAVRISS